MPRIKTLTKSQRRDLHNLQMTVFVARDKVFAVYESRDVPFIECFAAASDDVKAYYRKAVQDLAAFEREMVAQGRGFFDQFTTFHAY